ncbi:MAG TPA: hypothetical protein DDW52_05735 [Planctomycetaceae bacterium]|nr:hypothetical protein [Planctomycetaceae bacterium]
MQPADQADDPEPDPALKAMKFRDLVPPRPECELIGVQYMSTATPGFTQEEAFYEAYTVEASSLTDPWFDGTGILPGDTFLNRVGYEWDQIVSGCRSTDPQILLRYDTNNGKDAQATKYVAPSGATVFSTGSMGFSFGLDDWRFSGAAVSPADSRLQTFTRNVLTDLSNVVGSAFGQSTDGNGVVQIEVEDFQNATVASNRSWSTVAEAAASGGEAMFAGPDDGLNVAQNYEQNSPRLDFNIDFTETGTHYVWVLGRAAGSTPGSSDSIHAGLDGAGPATARRIQNYGVDFGWSSQIAGGSRATLDVPSTGLHTLNLWMREDGFMADKVVLTTNPTTDIDSLLASFQQGTDGNGLLEIEAEQFDSNTSVGSNNWSLVAEPNASGGEAMFAGPDTGDNIASNYAINSPRMDYTIQFNEIGTHYVWVLGSAAGIQVPSSDSVHAGLNGIEVPTLKRIQNFSSNYDWSNTISGGGRATFDVPSVGVHTFNLWMREDGFSADKIVITTNPTFNIDALLNPPDPDPSFFQDAGPDGIVDIEAELFDAQGDASGHTWNVIADVSASGGQAMIANPETGANINSNYSLNSPNLDYYIDFVQTGTHYVWILGRAGGATTGSSDSVHAGLDGVEVPGLRYFRAFDAVYDWSGISSAGRATMDIDTVGTHTLNVWMREDAFVIDRILVTTNPTSDIQSLLGSGLGGVGGASNSASAFSMDTNLDGQVSPVDVLLVVNYLNDPIAGQDERNGNVLTTQDVDGNGVVSPRDVLLIVNHLNATSAEDEPREVARLLDAPAVDEALAEDLYLAPPVQDAWFEGRRKRNRVS